MVFKASATFLPTTLRNFPAIWGGGEGRPAGLQRGGWGRGSSVL